MYVSFLKQPALLRFINMMSNITRVTFLRHLLIFGIHHEWASSEGSGLFPKCQYLVLIFEPLTKCTIEFMRSSRVANSHFLHSTQSRKTTFLFIIIFSLIWDYTLSQRNHGRSRLTHERSDAELESIDARGDSFLTVSSDSAVSDLKNRENESPDGNMYNPACPFCSAETLKLRTAIHSFWRDDLLDTYACICELLSDEKGAGTDSNIALAASIMSVTVQSRNFLFDVKREHKTLLPKQDPPISILDWEVLGPMPVSRLKIDGDPSFMAFNEGIKTRREVIPIRNRAEGRGFDAALHILSMHHLNSTVISEFVSGGMVKWQIFHAGKDGEVVACCACLIVSKS